MNDLIKRVKRFETRKQGAPSQARRPLRQAEIKAALHELRNQEAFDVKYGIPALLCFQFHVIGRIDDCCKWYRTNIAQHEGYPGKAARFRLAWSKNVSDERDAPWQHIFGCMDWVFCTILHLGLWLEIYHTTNQAARTRPFVFMFTDDNTSEEKTAQRSKNRVYRVLKPILEAIGLEGDNGKVGTHSIRKLASTFARLLGISKDDRDTRGRWKGRKRVSDVYDDVQLDYVDARVAATLSPGGVCHYVIADPGVTSEWIAETVTPQINAVFGTALAVLFGKAILWLAFSPHQEHMPPDMRERIQQAYLNDRATLPEGENPIRRHLVTVTGNDTQVFMEDVPPQDGTVAEDEQGDHGNQAAPVHPVVGVSASGFASDTNQQLLLSVISQIQGLKATCTEQTNALEIMRGTLRRHDKTVSHLARKIDNNPLNLLRRAANANPNPNPENTAPRSPTRTVTLQDEGCAPNAVLASHPRTLHEL